LSSILSLFIKTNTYLQFIPELVNGVFNTEQPALDVLPPVCLDPVVLLEDLPAVA
jgi:hypothetical protein